MPRYRRGIVSPGDPWPYDGPIQRVDGRRPYNRYLWPTEQELASDTLGHAAAGHEWRIDIIALANGRWATGGFVHEIERDQVLTGERCCFATRSEAVRAQAARLIRRARRQGRGDLVQWAREAAARLTDEQPDLFERLAA